MSAQIIIFDEQYTGEIVKNINQAGTLINEALNTLRRASEHRAWQCPEVKNINDNIDNISSRLKRLDRGLTATANALKRGQERFVNLETRSDRQVAKLSENLREKYGFSASVRGKNETTNLPVTEIPQKKDSWISQIIKGSLKNTIKGVGTLIGTVAGALGNGINKAAEGFITDVKDAFITPMVNIFQASYSLRETLSEPPYDDTAQALLKIASNSAGLLANAITLGGAGKLVSVTEKVTSIGDKIGDITTYADAANISITSAQNLTSGNIEEFQSNLNDVVGLVTDTITPLDQTILQGVEGMFTGAKSGAEVGYNFSNVLCTLLGL